jgi:hypothetical protein
MIPRAKFRNVRINGPDIVDYSLWLARLESLKAMPDVIDPENGSQHQRVAVALDFVRERMPKRETPHRHILTGPEVELSKRLDAAAAMAREWRGQHAAPVVAPPEPSNIIRLTFSQRRRIVKRFGSRRYAAARSAF